MNSTHKNLSKDTATYHARCNNIYSKILKAYEKLHWYFWRSDKIFRNAGFFSRDGRQPETRRNFLSQSWCQQKCSPGSLVSDDMQFIQIMCDILGEKASNDSNFQFVQLSFISMERSEIRRHDSTTICSLSWGFYRLQSRWPWMTLNNRFTFSFAFAPKSPEL